MPKRDRDHAREREIAEQFAAFVEPMFNQQSDRFRLGESAKRSDSPTPGLITDNDLHRLIGDN